MLEVKDLYAGYGPKTILKDISFTAAPGEIVAIVGESGTGKTTLAMSIMGMLGQQSKDGRTKGGIYFNGINLCGADKQQWASIRWKKISMVFQNVENILNPTLTIYHQLIEIANSSQDVSEMLNEVGFPAGRHNAYPHQLSMGEKQKALVAMAYVCRPELVLLDEPTSSLDHKSKQDLIETIKKISGQKTVILVTHDLETAQKLSHRALVLYGGSIVELGPTEMIFSQPRHPYTRGLIRSYPSMDRTKDLQGIRGKAEFVRSGCPFWPRCTQRIDVCRLQKPELKVYSTRSLACHRKGIIALLKARGIEKAYGKDPILEEVDLDIYEGETVTLLGQSGSGKTTLAKIIMGLIYSDRGEIFLENEPVHKWDLDFYGRVQMIFQDIRSAISHRLKVLEAVSEPLVIQKWGNLKQRTDKVRQVLEEVELPSTREFLETYPHHLSGGELQRVAIARALVISPKLIIADEPTSSLDASIQAKVLKLLNQIQEQRGLGMLFITHDLGVARKVSDRIVLLEHGKIKSE